MMKRFVAGAVLVTLSVVAALAQSAASGDKAEALSEAARRGDAATVNRLLDEGVDVNTKYRYGATVLFYACDRGHLEVVKLLLDRGADVNIEDTFYHATPLTWASSPAMTRKPQHAEIVGLLLKRGARRKEDALMSAVSARDTAMAKVILDHRGLSPDTLSDALESAKTSKHEDLVALLERAGAKPRVEFKLDAAELVRYAGTYRNERGGEIVITVTGGRLTGRSPGQQITMVARDATTFGIAESPGATIAFRFEAGRPTAFTINEGANVTTYTRVEGT